LKIRNEQLGGIGVSLGEIRDIIINNNSFVITSHINPDGDAVGSSLGLALALRGAGKDVVVVLDGFTAKFLKLPGIEMIESDYLNEFVSGSVPVLICLDCATKERLYIDDKFDKFAVTVNMDHHISNTNYAGYNYIDARVASASEVVFALIDGFLPVDKDIAEVLLLGLLTDTGGLAHSNTSPQTLYNAARLIELGADITKIKKRILNNRKMPEAKIFGLVLGNLKMMHGNIAVSYIMQQDFEKAGASYADVDGVVEFLLEVEGAAASLLFSEREGGVKVNFRSIDYNVSKIAAQFGGGGHVNAAGAMVEGNINDVMNVVVEAVRKEVVVHSE